ncbi:hypothetical protein ASPACDRAFT_120677 [Aspergillus aculeatus ATCC 16872]|uniref:DUF6594 domain-containing protein n=1 Tax=Aspergillus aculeatus (strain ATCC 16872 / CBS 172.66 / WB 5094) TaxID=690307 RepID=A0A1L9WT35_ASPA1|nr:uncharacterized protein ASPACDRAFT_120677 [Aspergillus aculeatus ATCC 16872]OJJ99341.1 hypothetical protein ASPACDRAFT_120677 [Aspergillus aculeatus ATCC 16872]
MNVLSRTFLSRKIRTPRDLESQNIHLKSEKIEDFPAGYPRFCALISSTNSLQLYRRFSILRSRDLLLKQDRLSILEKRLQDLDLREEKPSYLGSCRRDLNNERQAVLSDISKALFDYDQTLLRNSRIADLKHAGPRQVVTLRNWIEGNACVSRSETDFLQHDGDLIALSSPKDETLACLEEWVEDRLISLFTRSYKNQCQALSDDPMVYIPHGILAIILARALLGTFVVILIMVPVLICNFLLSVLLRLVVVSLATTAFIAFLSGGTHAKTIEILAAAAAYAAILTVYVTQS